MAPMFAVEAEPTLAVAMVAKFAPAVAALAAAKMAAVEVALPAVKCPPWSALPAVVQLDQYFAAVQLSLDSSR